MDAEDVLVEGYRQCVCGAWLPDHRRICSDCGNELIQGYEEAVILDIEGLPVKLPARKKAPRKQKRPPGDRGMRTRARDRARMRAWVRLARIYQPMFEVIFTEELLREGLEPIGDREVTVDSAAVIESLIADLEDYRERVRVTLEAQIGTVGGEAPSATA